MTIGRYRLGLAAVLLAAQPAVAADKEVWTPIGTAGNGDSFSLDYSREEIVTNEFGNNVIRIWMRIDLLPRNSSDAKRLSFYEVDCAAHSGRVLDGLSYDKDGKVTDRFVPPKPNPMETIGERTMATKIYKLVCKVI